MTQWLLWLFYLQKQSKVSAKYFSAFKRLSSWTENLCFLPQPEQRHSCFFEKHHYSFSQHQRPSLCSHHTEAFATPGISLGWKIATMEKPTLLFLWKLKIEFQPNTLIFLQRFQILQLKLFPSICLNKPIRWSDLLWTNKSATPGFLRNSRICQKLVWTGFFWLFVCS